MLPILVLATLLALAMLAYEATLSRWHRRRPAGPAPSDSELTRWLPVMDKVLRSKD